MKFGVARDPVSYGLTSSFTDNKQTVLDGEAVLGRKYDIDRRFFKWEDVIVGGAGNQGAYVEWSAARGVTPWINLTNATRSGSPTFRTWATIAAGTQDTYLTTLGNALKAWGARAYFCFHHEPEGKILAPAYTTSADGHTTNSSTTITSATGYFSSSIHVGATITGTNIPNGTTISSVTNSTTAVLSAAATGTATTTVFTVTPVDATKYGTAVDYKAAWAHIRSLFDGLGVTNLMYVFDAGGFAWNQDPTQSANIANYQKWAGYTCPPSTVVDYVACNPFNFVYTGGSPNFSNWTTFTSIVSSNDSGNAAKSFYGWTAANMVGVPLMVGAAGVINDPGTAGRQATWYSDASTDLFTTHPRIVAYIAYDQFHDNTLQTTASVWQTMLTKSYLDTYASIATIQNSHAYALTNWVKGSNGEYYTCTSAYTSAGSAVQPQSDATHWTILPYTPQATVDAYKAFSAAVAASTFSATFDTTGWDDGDYTFKVTATDTGSASTVAKTAFSVANGSTVPDVLTLYCEIEFTDGVWTDFTSRLRTVDTKLGRDTQLDTFSAGTATFTFKDLDRALDPSNSAGTYYGKLLPRRRIRFRAAYGGTLYPVWQGYIDSYEHESQADQPNVLFCTVTATDGFKMAALATLGQSVYEYTVAADLPSSWYPMSETSGLSMTDVSGFGNHGRYSTSATELTVPSLVATGHDQTSLDFSGGEWAQLPRRAQLVDAPFSIECWIRTTDNGGIFQILSDDNSASLTVAVSSSKLLARAQSPGGNAISATSNTSVSDGRPHHIVVSFVSLDAAPVLWVDGVRNVDTSSAAGTVVLTTGVCYVARDKTGTGHLSGAMAHLALYEPDLTPVQVSAHYAAGSAPLAGLRTGEALGSLLDAVGVADEDRDLDAGVTILGPVTYDNPAALTLLQTIETTERGRLWCGPDGKWTFRSRYYGATDARATTAQASFSDASSTFGSSGPSLTMADIFTGTTMGDYFSPYLGYGAGGLPYQTISYHDDDNLIFNTITVTGRSGVPQTVTDATSIATYGPRSMSIDGLWQSDEEAASIAMSVLRRYKDPKRRYETMSFRPARAPAVAFPAALGLGVADRINVTHQPAKTGTAWSVDVFVEGVAHAVDCTDGTDWVTTFSLGPTDRTNLFRAGISKVGGTDTVAA